MTKTWRDQISDALADFDTVTHYARIDAVADVLEAEYCPAPHSPPARLPPRKKAVYGFWWNGECLKIGKVGPKSGARYTSQHYSLKGANSNLCKSLLNDPRMDSNSGFSALRDRPGDWVKKQTSRVNILLPAQTDDKTIALLEAFLHCRFRPRYEGS